MPAADSPDPEMVQLLTPDGERISNPSFGLEISDAEIGSLYRDLVLTRRRALIYAVAASLDYR